MMTLSDYQTDLRLRTTRQAVDRALARLEAAIRIADVLASKVELGGERDGAE